MPLARLQDGRSPYRRHLDQWKDGCGTTHCEHATNVVICRGQLPCDILLIGEAPGSSEDAVGEPFVGPAGVLLDNIVLEALETWQVPGTKGYGYNELSVAYTNLVGCLPRNEDGKKDPEKNQIKACSSRLREFVGIAKPKLVVCVGSVSDKHAWSAFEGKGRTIYAGVPNRVEGHPTVKVWTSIVHPASILRAPDAQKSLLRQRCVVTIRRAVMKLLGEE